MNQRIEQLALQAGGSHFPTVGGKNLEKFAELIIQECIDCCGSQADRKNIRKRFGLPVESNIKYAGAEPQGHHTQYGREYDMPGE